MVEDGQKNQIAWIDVRGVLRTAEPAGADERTYLYAPDDLPNLTAGAANWPVWSPAGDRIAVSWVGQAGGRLIVRLLVVDVASGEFRALYESPPDVPPGIAPNVPHYMAWSPDGRSLAFLTMTAAGQTLLVGPADGSAGLQAIATGAPFFFTWSPDGTRLLVHLRDELFVVTPGGPLRPLGIVPAAFRVPAWSPDGRTCAVAEETADGSRLLLIAADGDERRSLGPSGPGAAFAWSPDSRSLAISQPGAPGDAYRGIEVVAVEDGRRRRVTRDDVLAFFWSPNGREIAYAGIDLARSEMYWSVVGADGSNGRRVATFVPSRDLMTALGFFDQYAASVRLWSPDSRSLVIAGRWAHPLRGNGRSGANAHEDQVQSVDVFGERPPTRFGAGTLGFWVPG